MSMLKVYDQNHNFVNRITAGIHYKNLSITRTTGSGDEEISFTVLPSVAVNIDCEYYVQTEEQEYVIKSVQDISGGEKSISGNLNLEDLQAITWQNFSLTKTTAEEAVKAAITSSGWTVKDFSDFKVRNVSTAQKTALGAISEIAAAFMVEIAYHTISKKIDIFTRRGEDKGAYFISGLNLRKLTIKTTSYDFATMIEPYGADDLTIESVNEGSKRLVNHDWSSKNVCLIYKDTNYTNAQALKDDMTEYLADLSKPRRSYSVDVIDLAKMSDEYDVLSYGIGDVVWLIDDKTGTREKQRIKKITEYPDEPEKSTCEISNTLLTWEELQAKLQKAQALTQSVITSDGKINVSDILKFERGQVVSDGDVLALESYVNKTDARLAALEGGN